MLISGKFFFRKYGSQLKKSTKNTFFQLFTPGPASIECLTVIFLRSEYEYLQMDQVLIVWKPNNGDEKRNNTQKMVKMAISHYLLSFSVLLFYM